MPVPDEDDDVQAYKIDKWSQLDSALHQASALFEMLRRETLTCHEEIDKLRLQLNNGFTTEDHVHERKIVFAKRTGIKLDAKGTVRPSLDERCSVDDLESGSHDVEFKIDIDAVEDPVRQESSNISDGTEFQETSVPELPPPDTQSDGGQGKVGFKIETAGMPDSWMTPTEGSRSLKSQQFVSQASSVSLASKPQLHRSCTSLIVTESEGPSLAQSRGECAVAIWNFLDDPESSKAAYYFSKTLGPLVQISVVLTVMQTSDKPPLQAETYAYIQMCIDTFFLLELLARFVVCPNIGTFHRNFHNITDCVAAALPLSLRLAWLIGGLNLQEGAVKYLIFCLTPILRELKVLRRVQQFHLFIELAKQISEAVQVLMMLLTIFVLVFSSLLYMAEPDHVIGSLPRGIWLTLVTMTTVGYGDITPETLTGTLVTSCLALCSIMYMAMPLGIIGNAFTQIWQDRDSILVMLKTREIMVQSGYTAKDLPAIFLHYSAGEDEIDYLQFQDMVRDMNLGINEVRAMEVFESIDRDGGGSIDLQEFVRSIFPSAIHEVTSAKAKPDANHDDKFPRQVSPGRQTSGDKFARQSSGDKPVRRTPQTKEHKRHRNVEIASPPTDGSPPPSRRISARWT